MDPTLRGRTPQVPYSSAHSRRRISPRLLLLVLVAVIAITIGAVLLSSSGDKTGPLQQRLTARLVTFQRIVAEGKTNISNTDLRNFNSRLDIQLQSDSKTLADAYRALGTKNPSGDITALETDEATFTALKDAALNSRFDAAYRKAVAQKLDSTAALMKEIHDKTRSKSLREALATAYRNLKTLETQLAAETSS